MDLLRPWIGPYVHQVLTEAQQWKAQNLQGSKLAASGRYEDDGSNLRVKSRVKSDEEAVVQFTKVKAPIAAPSWTAQLMLYLDPSNRKSYPSIDL